MAARAPWRVSGDYQLNTRRLTSRHLEVVLLVVLCPLLGDDDDIPPDVLRLAAKQQLDHLRLFLQTLQFLQ